MGSEDLYEEIDEALVPMHEHLAAMLEVDGLAIDEENAMQMQISEISIESPLQLDIITGTGNEMVIGSSPPLYYMETGILPVFHSIKCRIVAERTENFNEDES